MRKALITAALCLACGSSMASDDKDPWSARGMYDAAKVLAGYTYGASLSDEQKGQMALALGWFSGSMNAMAAVGALSPEQKFICLSERRTASDVAREYVDYVDAHHGRIPDDPMVVLIDSLRHDHPCK